MSVTSATHTKHVLITGASGGIGSALARCYARPGTRLTLWGRKPEALAQLADSCRGLGAQTAVVCQDTRELEKTRAMLTSIDLAAPLDLVFLNAGVNSGTHPDGSMESPPEACRTMQVNALGTINMASAILQRMLVRNAGRIVLTSSLAGLYPLPDFAAYSASKVAVAYYAKSMRAYASASQVKISVIYPGYVDTDMANRLTGLQPMRWAPEKAAAYIQRKVDRGAGTIVFPRLLALGTCVLHLLPGRMADFFAKKFSFTVEPDQEAKRMNDHACVESRNLTGVPNNHGSCCMQTDDKPTPVNNSNEGDA